MNGLIDAITNEVVQRNFFLSEHPLILEGICSFGCQTLQDCKDALSPLLQVDTEKSENLPQINEAAKECIKKLSVEFQTKMSDDLQTPVILNGALLEALKYVNSSLKLLKVCIWN